MRPLQDRWPGPAWTSLSREEWEAAADSIRRKEWPQLFPPPYPGDDEDDEKPRD